MTGAEAEAVTRREQILGTAATLFARRGFHGVSVVDIGAACGISGPALYKHFTGKGQILAEMLVSISERLLTVGQDRVRAASGPADAVRRLVDWHVDFAVHHQALIIVQDRDWSSLPDAARDRVRTLQREYVDLWADQLRLLDPGVGVADSQARAHATFGLINSTPHSGLLPEARMRTLLAQMAVRALGLPADDRGAPS
ncbi:TetR/AcrR family transcriptional regulator [Nocardioides sp.]|uniref:TetR/AcrR family transcriptional regulator n=1 Tax=Nocardioides sp. TaxID=35761 RepID=UPI000C8B13F2|nr:TetR/AcrR family transcriptional regulator [Nocardioides sp.]MAS55095.1 TetR family transcriptional regulator [Pimelobacter sp.]MDE0778682.1 TetR/AcrR family transcriptional regulator [Nocardioides sp.]